MGGNVRPAKEISEEILEVTAQAMLSNDFESFAPWFHLPHYISSTKDKVKLTTREETRVMFDKVVEYYTLYRVTELIRIVEVSEYLTPTRIEATHITHVMSGSQRVVGSYPCYSVLKLTDGRWQLHNSQYAVDEHTTVGYALSSMAMKPQHK